MRQRILSLLLLLLSAGGLAYPATLIDFDSLSDGDSITNQLAGQGVTFQNAIALTAGLSLNEFEFPPFSGSSVLGDNGGPIIILFSALQSMVFANFTYATPVTIEAFGATNVSLGMVSSAPGCASNRQLTGTAGCPSNEQLTLLGIGSIARITITASPGGNSFALDDLTFEAASVTVPEPSSLVIAGSALAALGLLRRAVVRRNQTPTIRSISA